MEFQHSPLIFRLIILSTIETMNVQYGALVLSFGEAFIFFFIFFFLLLENLDDADIMLVAFDFATNLMSKK